MRMLLSDGFLPKEVKRLPRFSTAKVGFKINHDYYENNGYEYGKGDAHILLKIIQSKENYEQKIPEDLGLISYEKLKEQWEDKGKNKIYSLCLENKLPAYLRVVPERDVRSFISNDHLSICRQKNCGNSSYLKRYNGLEKLILKETPVNRGRDLEGLWSSPSIKIKSDITLNINLQSTDIETKFHIQRVLVSSTFDRKKGENTNEIKKEDLVFLEEDVENIEQNWMLSTNIRENRLSFSQITPVISGHTSGGGGSPTLQTNKTVIWNDLVNN